VNNLTSLVVAAMSVSMLGCSGSKFMSATSNSQIDHGTNKTCTMPKKRKFTNALDFKIQEEMMSSSSVEASTFSKKSTSFQTPTRKLALKDWPSFTDDLDFDNMVTAIDRQIKRYNQIDLRSRTVEYGGRSFPATVMLDSLNEFKTLVKAYLACQGKSRSKGTCQEDLVASLQQHFDVYIPDLKPGDTRYGEVNPVLFTAYYTPTLEASVAKTAGKPYPIYKAPPAKDASHSRDEIDFDGALAGKGLELFYAPDLFDLYLLHVQGGGIASVTDAAGNQTQYYLSYDGTNGKAFTFISKYMKSKGYIPDLSIEAQRTFLRNHPEKQKEIYATCPSYVYFKLTSNPPQGSDSVPLTDNRSIATDTGYYAFKGGIAFVTAHRPADPYDPSESCEVGTYKPLSRFYLDQDTGGAIKGKGRVDLYFGESRYAEVAAYNTVERGNLYFLLLKP
jgi:membrane-bound lytic murein transglycosylase A